MRKRKKPLGRPLVTVMLFVVLPQPVLVEMADHSGETRESLCSTI